jgi:3-hydroxyacyl-CoA dehydrogenase/enoyl-CoA hydratase/3-hydroxybutyryl-CoA epimerase/enoyl-CoA isomerase
MAKKYEALGPLYQPTEKMKQMAAAGDKYFSEAKG